MLSQVLQISEQMLDMIQSQQGLDLLDRFEVLEQQRKTMLKEYSDQSGSAEELRHQDAALLVQIKQLSNAIELAARSMKIDLRTRLIGNRKNQKNIMAYG